MALTYEWNRSTAPAAAAALLLAAVTLAGCGARGREVKAEAAAKPRDTSEIVAAGELAALVKVGAVQQSEVAAKLRVPGRVEADETRIARVNSPVGGRIIDLEVVEGQTVKRGQLIAVISSTQLTDAQSSYLKAISQRRLAERAVDRAKRLLDAGVIGEAELQRRDAELVQATADVAALHDQLRVLGATEDEIQRMEKTRTVTSKAQVVATIDGTVLQRKATPGQVVQAAEEVCVLADLSRVWLVADVPEQAAGQVEAGQFVEAEIPALPDHPVRGRLTFVSATVNPETRTVRIRMDLPNPQRKFKPAMLATMLLQERAERALVIPSGALVREGGRHYVFVETAANRYKLRQLSVGEEVDGRLTVLDGLNAGEKIVLEGSFHLNNERQRQALRGN